MDSVVLVSLVVAGAVILIVAAVVIFGKKMGGRPTRDLAGPTPQAESALAEMPRD